MKSILFGVVISATAIAGTAQAQAPSSPAQPLPILGGDSAGPGAQPVLGVDGYGKPAVIYRDPTTNGWVLWQLSGGMFSAAPLSPYASAVTDCTFSGDVLFCNESWPPPPPPYAPPGAPPQPYIEAHDFTTGTSVFLAGTNNLGDSYWGRAVTENLGQLALQKYTGSGISSTAIPSSGASRPVTDANYAVFQTSSGGSWSLNVNQHGSGTTSSSNVGSTEPRPDVLDGLIVYEEGGTINYRLAVDVDDPKSVIVDPAAQGCLSYHEPKIGVAGVPGIYAVRAEGCPNASGSKLYVLNNVFGAYTAYEVGDLGAGHEFDVFEDHIVWVEPSGKLLWVQVDFNRI